MMLQGGSAAGLGFDDVSIFRRDRVDAEVPDAEIDHLGEDNLHQRKLTEVERLFGDDLEPVASRKKLSGGLDDVLLSLAGTKHWDAEAVDDSHPGADVGADDDVAAIG